VTDQVFSVDCFIVSEDDDKAGENAFFYKVAFMTFAPFLIVILASIV